MHRLAAAIPILLLASATLAQTAVDPRGRSILFVRGEYASGGATEGGTPQQRTEQLSDIFNNATNNGNHGYGELRAALVNDGFTASQLIESSTPITLALLAKHRIVVMGSNNKVYSAAEVTAFHAYVDAGGSALFISDANWGLTWEKAPASDNQFLGRYGAQVYQDSGQVPNMARTTTGRYLLPNHPALSGPDGAGGKSDVNNYNGEGVSLFRITTGSHGWQFARLVSANGLNRRLNDASGKAGAIQPATATDAAMIFAEKGNSRLLGHFDRNTFFNLNGAGTDIQKLNNTQLALNIFRYLASVKADATSVGAGCGSGQPPILAVSPPILGRSTQFVLTGAAKSAAGWLLVAPGAPKPVSLGGCTTFVDLATAQVTTFFSTDTSGNWGALVPLPEDHTLSGLRATVQTLTFVTAGPFFGGGELSNGIDLTLGFHR